MLFLLINVLGTLMVFLCMLGLIDAGWKLGRRRLEQNKGEQPGLGVMEAFVFGLLGLLIAFNFTGAMSRFDVRRALITEEANAISTAYLRLDLLPAASREPLQAEFKTYTESRLEYFRNFNDRAATKKRAELHVQMQGKIWSQAVAACQSQPSTPATMLLLPALNEMIDITTTREMALRTHPPMASVILLACLALASSFLAGFAMRESSVRSWPHIITFLLMAGATLYLIMDVEYPRVGLVRVDSADFVLEGVLDSMR
jgi:hypothetical protein